MKWLKKVAATPLTSIAKVVDSLQTQTNNRTNAPSIRAVNEAINKNWLTIYPIGSIYMCVNDINPSEVFGGTWVQIKDRFLLAAGDIYNNGATGGEANVSYTPSGTVGNHTLTINEIPAHTHKYADFPEYHSVALGESQYVAGINESLIDTTSVGGGQAHNHNFTGTNVSLNNMPPYLAVKVWKRTA